MNKNQKEEKTIFYKILTLLPIVVLCLALAAFTFFSKKIEESKVNEAKTTIIEKSKALDSGIKDLKDNAVSDKEIEEAKTKKEEVNKNISEKEKNIEDLKKKKEELEAKVKE